MLGLVPVMTDVTFEKIAEIGDLATYHGRIAVWDWASALRRCSGTDMKKRSLKPTHAQRRELKALAKLPDGKIDTSDAPPLSDWSGAKRGLFHARAKRLSKRA